MDVGLRALEIGTGARRDVIDAVARAAEAGGFADAAAWVAALAGRWVESMP